MEDFDALKLGTDDRQLPLGGIAQNRAAAHSLFRQARQGIRIVSRYLDPPVLNHPEFVDAARTLIRNNSHSRIQMLVFEPGVLTRRGHCLLTLAQHLSSFVECRKPDPEHENFAEAFLLVDRAGLLHRPLASRWEGIVNFNDPLRVKQLQTEFDRMWELAVPDLNLHRLTL